MPNILICCSSLFVVSLLAWRAPHPICRGGLWPLWEGRAPCQPCVPFLCHVASANGWAATSFSDRDLHVSQCRPRSLFTLQPWAKFLPPPFFRGDFIPGHSDQKPETVGCAIASIPPSSSKLQQLGACRAGNWDCSPS